MKKIILIMLLQTLVLSCNLDTLIGYEEYSYNIGESKKGEYFITEFKPSQTDFKINDTIYKIKEVWSENAWTYKNHNLDKEKLRYNHFIIWFNQDWVVRIKYENENFDYNGYGWRNDKMVFRLTETELKKDTIKLYFFIDKDTIPVLFIKKK